MTSISPRVNVFESFSHTMDALFVVSFAVKDAQEGWDLTGEVSAKYCPWFNELCV